jgi:hypothetical protein
MFKAVGMRIVIEGLALYNFREMREITREPLLKEMLLCTLRDASATPTFSSCPTPRNSARSARRLRPPSDAPR